VQVVLRRIRVRLQDDRSAWVSVSEVLWKGWKCPNIRKRSLDSFKHLKQNLEHFQIVRGGEVGVAAQKFHRKEAMLGSVRASRGLWIRVDKSAEEEKMRKRSMCGAFAKEVKWV